MEFIQRKDVVCCLTNHWYLKLHAFYISLLSAIFKNLPIKVLLRALLVSMAFSRPTFWSTPWPGIYQPSRSLFAIKAGENFTKQGRLTLSLLKATNVAVLEATTFKIGHVLKSRNLVIMVY